MNADNYPTLPLNGSGQYDPTRLASYWVEDDPHQPEPQTWDYYRVKAQIAAYIMPKRVVEIGVRAGYSALAFYMGYPYQEFYGLDMDEGGWGGVKGYLNLASNRLAYISHSVAPDRAVIEQLRQTPGPTLRYTLEKGDSQSIKELPLIAQNADLFHVDGDHSPKGTAHDILIGLTSGAKYIVVDDYDYTEHVAEGADWAIQRFGLQAWYVGDGGYRGNVVIKGKRA